MRIYHFWEQRDTQIDKEGGMERRRADREVFIMILREIERQMRENRMSSGREPERINAMRISAIKLILCLLVLHMTLMNYNGGRKWSTRIVCYTI